MKLVLAVGVAVILAGCSPKEEAKPWEPEVVCCEPKAREFAVTQGVAKASITSVSYSRRPGKSTVWTVNYKDSDGEPATLRLDGNTGKAMGEKPGAAAPESTPAAPATTPK